MLRRGIRIRLRFLTLGLFAVALFLILRLYYVQIMHGEDFSLRAERQYVSASQELYDRGSIFFTRKDGTLLTAAGLATGFTIAMNPGHLEDPEAAYAALSSIVPVDYAEFMEAAGKKDDPYEVLLTRVDEERGIAVQEQEIPGIQVERQRWRSYPAKDDAAQSIGFVAYDNDNTLAGRTGLERYYDDVLSRGSVGIFNNFFAELFANIDNAMEDARTTREGDVITTIEPMVQEKLGQILAQVASEYGSEETGGIIMDPKTGEIIALDTNPTFDASDFRNGDPENFGNPLVENRYEFGSIVKALTMAAGLDSNAITADTTYNDTGCITVNTQKICNFDLKARGVVQVQEVLSQSLNVGASYIAIRTGHDRFRTYFTKLGMGEETGVDLPSEIPGDLHNILESPRDVEYSTASFGQGIAQTPMEMIKAMGALANKGSVVTPHLVRAIRLENGLEKTLSWGNPTPVFSPAATEATTRMLVRVVDEHLANGSVKIPEMSVAAKTGTAQIAGPGGKYNANQYFHSFFGYFPAYDPKFVVVLYTLKPQGVQYASETLTHPFMDITRFLINYYEIPPDRASVPGA